MIKISIVDDNEFFRLGLKSALVSLGHYKVIGEFSNGKEFLESMAVMDSDIVLIDIKMPDMNGIETTRILLKKNPQQNVIAITMFGEEHYLREMLLLDINGFILKDIEKETLDLAIKQVIKGHKYYSGEILQKFSQLFINPTQTHLNDAILTSREMEILTLVAQGKTNTEIADMLCLSLRTVEGHKNKIITKTGSKNIINVLIQAIKENIIDINRIENR